MCIWNEAQPEFWVCHLLNTFPNCVGELPLQVVYVDGFGICHWPGHNINVPFVINVICHWLGHNINNWLFGRWEQAVICAGGLGTSRTSSQSQKNQQGYKLCFGRIYCSFLNFSSLFVWFFFFPYSLKMILNTFDSFRKAHVFHFHVIRTECTESILLLNKNPTRLQPHRSFSIRFGCDSVGWSKHHRSSDSGYVENQYK